MSIEPILDSTPFIRWHLALALLAFPLGLSQLLLKKGTARHKILGYIFVLFVAMLCFVSFFIKSLFPSLGLEKIFLGFRRCIY